MTVFYAVGVSSNSLETPKVKSSDVAHAINFTSGTHILKPKIDKFSCVFDIENQRHQLKVELRLEKLLGSKDFQEYGPTSYKVWKLGGYEVNVNLTEPTTGQSILIQARPVTKKKKNFMRFEWNPVKLGADGMKFFRKRLLDIFQGAYDYSDIAKDGKVTRVDAAFDILNISIGQIMVRSTKWEKSHVYYGIDGSAETIYIGAHKTNKTGHTAVYDKKQQLEDKWRKKKFGETPHTRLEARIRANRPIIKLPYIRNPLLKLEVFLPGGVEPPEGKHHWEFFLDSCRFRGFANALSMLPEDVLPAYEAALEEAKSILWDPEKLWSYWPEALSDTGLLDT